MTNKLPKPERNPFWDLLKIYSERNPKGVSIYYGTDVKETWKEFNDRVNKLANALMDLKIKKRMLKLGKALNKTYFENTASYMEFWEMKL